jgi:hypothetical protein
MLRPSTLKGAGLALCLLAMGVQPVQAVLLQTSTSSGSPPATSPVDDTTPSLLVLVVVDQLRADLLTRYDTLFQGGLRRLLDHGRIYPNATHDHAITETSPGHATLATGTYPSRHGIVANVWWEEERGRWQRVENVVDEAAPLVDDHSLAGASPRKLERTGLADWLLAEHEDARVVSISAKDRAAVLMAGKSRGEVFWFDPWLGRFVTSTFYREDYPIWVTAYNMGGLVEYQADSVWTSSVPTAARSLTRRDTVSYENDGVHTAFPHHFMDVVSNPDYPPGFFEWLNTTPALDRAVLWLARMAAKSEELGVDDVPDLLAISLSQTDRIGHPFGPFSREQLDNLLRLDEELGAFLEFLDEAVGEGRYLMAFTADHGVLDIPEYRRERGMEGTRLPSSATRDLEVILGEVARENAGNGSEAVAARLAERAPELDWIADAWSQSELLNDEPADSFAVLFHNSYFAGRPAGLLSRFGVEMRMEPHTLTAAWPRGTTHGSPYYYDRLVPLIFLGGEVESGWDSTRASAVDVAPTLAALAGIPTPGDLDGEPLFR